MVKRYIGWFTGIVVLLAGCQQYNNTPTQTAVPMSTQPAAMSTSVSAPPLVTPTEEPTADIQHLISVVAIQDRPDEIPQLLPRDDGFSQSEPWEIAEAFHPAEGMRFIALEVTALNLSETTWQFLGSKLVLTDATGKGYSTQLGRAYLGLMPFEIRFGQKVHGWVVFEIPEDAVAKEIMYPVDEKHWIVSPVDAQTPLPDAAPKLVASTSASASNLTLSLLAIKDPGTPFSTFTYTYVKGYRPVNIMIEIGNLSADEIAFRPHQFVLMDENGVLHFNQPGGASDAIDGDDLQPGETRKGEVSFDLPEGVKPSQLFYIVTPSTDNYLQINLR